MGDIEKSSSGQETERRRDSSAEDGAAHSEADTAWRIGLELVSDNSVKLDVSLESDAMIGRGETAPDFVDLSAYNAEALGVSRRHAVLRPTDTEILVLDLGSTNGTQLNGQPIEISTPHGLNDGDLLTLGSLEWVVRIINRPGKARVDRTGDLGDALAQLAKAITSQLDLDEVLDQALEMAMRLTAAGETAIWLVDNVTGELFLEAERGIEDEKIKRMRLPVTDTMAGQVIEDGQPRRVSRTVEGEKIKVKTGYMVEALIYAPLGLGGVTFGVLAAAHRELGQHFSSRDEKLLTAIADFAAIAIQNSRLHQATNEALAERLGELTELNSALAHDLRSPILSIRGFAIIVKRKAHLDRELADFVDRIIAASERTLSLLNQLLDIVLLSQAPRTDYKPCNLTEAVARAIGDLEGAALEKSIALDLRLVGTPYQIEGDSTRLYRCVLNLVDNAIKYSPVGTQVTVIITYGEDGETTIKVHDEGPGIPEEELPHIFDRFVRGKREKHAKEGIGLGLAIAQATAKAHGGEISVANAEGGGAEFVFSLPASLRVK